MVSLLLETSARRAGAFSTNAADGYVDSARLSVVLSIAGQRRHALGLLVLGSRRESTMARISVGS
jgi:hypothetical protein